MKIADFGLARDVHNIDYYKKTTNVSMELPGAAGLLLAGNSVIPAASGPCATALFLEGLRRKRSAGGLAP